MPTGKVRWFDKKKGYGFVDYEGKDVFIHHTAFKEKFILNDNDMISFEVIKSCKGLKAENISRII